MKRSILILYFLQLNKTVKFSTRIKSINLPKEDIIFGENDAVVAGWGALNIIESQFQLAYIPPKAKKMSVKIVAKERCNNIFNMELNQQTQICASPKEMHQTSSEVSINFEFIQLKNYSFTTYFVP